MHGDRTVVAVCPEDAEAVADHEAIRSMPDPHLGLDCREGLVDFYRECAFEVFDATTEVDGREESFVTMTDEFDR